MLKMLYNNSMLSVNGVYENGAIKILDHVSFDAKQDVIITFLNRGEENLHKEIYHLAEKGKSFDFLEDEEDLYSEKDLVEKY